MATHPAAAAPVVAPEARRGPELVERSPAHHDRGAAGVVTLLAVSIAIFLATQVLPAAPSTQCSAMRPHRRVPARQYRPAATPRRRIGW
jgi:hypothetical protein